MLPAPSGPPPDDVAVVLVISASVSPALNVAAYPTPMDPVGASSVVFPPPL